MTIAGNSIREWHSVDNKVFNEEIHAAGQPAVLRGLVSAWPATRAGLDSPASLTQYMAKFDSQQPVEVIIGPQAIQGQFFYDEADLRKVNFVRKSSPLSVVLEQLSNAQNAPAHSIAVQSLPILSFLPGFELDNTIPLSAVRGAPRMWIGNEVVVRTHLDYYDNVACVIGGKRRVTLFPPEQIANLYIGPIDNTPAGAPVSMVSPEYPDLDRYPLFAKALAASQTAELGPGDAIYIPYAWWHHVQSLEPFNVLVNYWWNDSPYPTNAPFICLMHALTALRTLPPRQRRVWHTFFDHYIFQEAKSAVEHLNPDQRGILGDMTPEIARQIRVYLSRILQQ
ncbi:MAG: cupin-like domain-containing protein [Steroidobacter sp.]